MNKALAVAVAVLFSGLVTASVNAGPNDPATPQTGESQVQKGDKCVITGQITDKKPNYSVAKEYNKRVANKKRAAEIRKKMIEEGK